MMSFEMFLCSLQEMQDFMSYENKFIFFCCLFLSFLIDELTMFCQLITFAY